MFCNHSRYDLGDEDASEPENDCISLPLYLYDHSGLTMKTTGFSCTWDSGRVGIIYVDIEKVKKEYNWKRITKKRRQQIEKYLISEVETYNAYLTGEVYGFIVKDNEGETIDSCWGFFGYDYCEQEGQESLEWFERQEKREHAKKNMSVPIH